MTFSYDTQQYRVKLVNSYSKDVVRLLTMLIVQDRNICRGGSVLHLVLAFRGDGGLAL